VHSTVTYPNIKLHATFCVCNAYKVSACKKQPFGKEENHRSLEPNGENMAAAMETAAAHQQQEFRSNTYNSGLASAQWVCQVVQVDDSNSDHGEMLPVESDGDDDVQHFLSAQKQLQQAIPYTESLCPGPRSVRITVTDALPAIPALITYPTNDAGAGGDSAEPEWLRQHATSAKFIAQTLDAVAHETPIYAFEMPTSDHTWPFMPAGAGMANSARVYLRIQAIGEALNMLKLWKEERFSECVDRNLGKFLEMVAQHPHLAPIRDTATLYVELTVRRRQQQKTAREQEAKLQQQRLQLARFQQKQDAARAATLVAAKGAVVRGSVEFQSPRKQRFRPSDEPTGNGTRKRTRGDGDDDDGDRGDDGAGSDDDASTVSYATTEIKVAAAAPRRHCKITEEEYFHQRRGYPASVCVAIAILEAEGKFSERVSIEPEAAAAVWQETQCFPPECGLLWSRILSLDDAAEIADILRHLFVVFVDAVGADVLAAFAAVYPDVTGEYIQTIWMPDAPEQLPEYNLQEDCRLWARVLHAKRDSSFGNPCSWSSIGVSLADSRLRKVAATTARVEGKGAPAAAAAAKCSEEHMLLGHVVAMVTNFSLPDELLEDFGVKLSLAMA